MTVELLAIAIILAGVLVARRKASRYQHDDGLFDERAAVFIFWLGLFTAAAIALVGGAALLA